MNPMINATPIAIKNVGSITLTPLSRGGWLAPDAGPLACATATEGTWLVTSSVMADKPNFERSFMAWAPILMMPQHQLKN